MSTPARSVIPASQKAVAEQNQFSPAVWAGDQLIISGQVGADPSGAIIPDPEGQIVAAFEALGDVLLAAGLGMQDVVELKSYHTEFDTLDVFMRVKARYLVGPLFPAWTIMGVNLAAPGSIIEIGAVAYRAENR